MTCFNWTIVLFLIFSLCGGSVFFIHQEVSIINRGLVKEVELLKQKSNGEPSGFSKKLDEVYSALKSLDGMKTEMADVKEKSSKVLHEVAHMRSTIEMLDKTSQSLKKKVDDSQSTVDSLKQGMESVKSDQSSKSGTESKIDDAVKRIEDLMAVSKTNVAFISDEVQRLDKQLKQQFEQVSSIQNDVISLTADKTENNAAIESIKSTVVASRDRIKEMEGTQNSGLRGIQEKIQDLEKKSTGEFERISREMSEQRENSAKWLQGVTDDLTKKLNTATEGWTQKIEELKAQAPAQEPAKASDNEAMINSIGALHSKFNQLSEQIGTLNSGFKAIQNDVKSQGAGGDQLAEMKKDITVITTKLRASKGNDEELAIKLDEITKQVTTLSNEVNRITTTSGILETRIEELRSTKDGQETKQ